jgi:hypothetical protein
MIPLVHGWLLIAALPLALTLLRAWPRVLCGVAMAGCALPFFLPASAPLLRAFALALSFLFLIKALMFAAGHVRPRGRIDFLLFIFTFAVVRWETPRRPDPRRAARSFLTGLGQFGLAWLIMIVVLRLDRHNPVQLFTAQVGFYLVVAAIFNLTEVVISLRGLDHADLFNNPLRSLTPGEFWGRRWNSWISHLLHRYVFLPAGGRRHPARGILAAFAASAVFHEVIADVGTRKFNGAMLAYFLIQGALVAVTARSPFVRRLARERPLVAWFLTTLLMLATGVLFIRGMDGIEPSYSWRRVFPPR